MNLVRDVKNKYLMSIIDDLEDMLNENKNYNKESNDISRTEYIRRTGIIIGLEKAIKVIKEYE